VISCQHEDSFFIALPYGDRTDWLKNVLAAGTATIVAGGQKIDVDRPVVVPIAEASSYFRPREQRMQRRFGVETALRARRMREDPSE